MNSARYCAGTLDARGGKVKDWNGKIVVICGGAKGLGAAMGRQLREKGATVVIFDLPRSLDEKRDELEGFIMRSCSVTCEEDLRTGFAAVRVEYGPIDTVIVSAGIGKEFPIIEGRMEDIEQMFGVNFFGPVRVARAAVEYLKETGGRILFMSSMSALIKSALLGGYGATKAALFIMGGALQRELKPTGVGVSVAILSRHHTDLDRSAFGTKAAELSPLDLIPPEKAEVGARRMIEGLEKGRSTIYSPWWVPLLLHTPGALAIAQRRCDLKMPRKRIAEAMRLAAKNVDMPFSSPQE